MPKRKREEEPLDYKYNELLLKIQSVQWTAEINNLLILVAEMHKVSILLDLNMQDKDQNTPLLWAIKHKDYTTIDKLLPFAEKIDNDNKPLLDLNRPNIHGVTALLYAVDVKDYTTIDKLLPFAEKMDNDNKPLLDLNLPDKHQNTPLSWAIKHNDYTTISKLLPFTKKTDHYGNTLITLSAQDITSLFAINPNIFDIKIPFAEQQCDAAAMYQSPAPAAMQPSYSAQQGYSAMQPSYSAMQPLGMYQPYPVSFQSVNYNINVSQPQALSSDDKEINTKLLAIKSGDNNISNNRTSSPKFSIGGHFPSLIQTHTYVDKTEGSTKVLSDKQPDYSLPLNLDVINDTQNIRLSHSPIWYKDCCTEQKVFSFNTEFKRLIQSKTYVDKTGLVKALLGYAALETNSCENQAVLITCPRRFGKSINMEMVQILLGIEVNEKGDIIPNDQTKIYKILHHMMTQHNKHLEILDGKINNLNNFKKYPVIFIDFQSIRGTNIDNVHEEFKTAIHKTFGKHLYVLNLLKKMKSDPIDSKQEYAKYHYDKFIQYYHKSKDLDESDWIDSLNFLSRVLCNVLSTTEKAILLIDEYDTPVNYTITHQSCNITEDTITEVQGFIDKLLINALKENKHLHLGFMTGVSGIVRATKNSALNNVFHAKFLDAKNKYQKYYGLNEEEVDFVLKEASIEKSADFKKSLKEKYNGYTYDTDKSLYNVWAVLLASREYNMTLIQSNKDHWTASANTRCIENAFKLDQIRPMNQLLMKGESIQIDLSDRVTVEELIKLKHLSSHTLATFSDDYIKLFFSYIFESGYLNVYTKNNVNFISIPNQDIRAEFIKQNIKYFADRFNISLSEPIKTFSNFILNPSDATKDTFVSTINNAISKVQFAQITSPKPGVHQNEDLFHSILNLIIMHSDEFYKFVTECTLTDGMNKGRPDIVFLTKSKLGVIVEVKYMRDVEKAVGQIDKKHYVNLFRQCIGVEEIKNIVKVGINFNKTEQDNNGKVMTMLYKIVDDHCTENNVMHDSTTQLTGELVGNEA